MKTDLNQEPVFLTDKNRIVVLEALCSAPNAALPAGHLRYWSQSWRKAPAKNIFRWWRQRDSM